MYAHPGGGWQVSFSFSFSDLVSPAAVHARLDLLAVFLGGDAGDLLEGAQEVGVVPEAAEEGDVAEGEGLEQLLLGQHDPAVEDVVVQAVMGIAHEVVGQGRYADAALGGQGRQGQGLGEVLVHVHQHVVHPRASGCGRLPRGGVFHRLQHDAEEGQYIRQVREAVIGRAGAAVVHQLPEEIAALLRFFLPQRIHPAVGPVRRIPQQGGQVHQAAADPVQEFRRAIQVRPLILRHAVLPQEAVHPERGDDHQLVRLHPVHGIVHAEMPRAADVQVDLIEIMAVEPVVARALRQAVVSLVVAPAVAHGAIAEVGELFL